MDGHSNPCHGQGGPQCWGPAGEKCPDCGRAWGLVPGPVRVSYSREEIASRLTDWMLCEFGNPKDLPARERAAWHQREGTILHFLRCHFPDASGKYFQDFLDQ